MTTEPVRNVTTRFVFDTEPISDAFAWLTELPLWLIAFWIGQAIVRYEGPWLANWLGLH